MQWWSRRDILCGGGVLERQCPDVEVQHPRKWGYPDEEEQGAL